MFKLPEQKGSSPVLPLTALAGAIIGATVTLLFTPRKGSDLRSGLKSKAQKIRSGFSTNGIGQLSYNKATMHPVETSETKDHGLSKAAAMVNHLKHNKQENNQFPNPL